MGVGFGRWLLMGLWGLGGRLLVVGVLISVDRTEYISHQLFPYVALYEADFFFFLFFFSCCIHLCSSTLHYPLA